MLRPMTMPRLAVPARQANAMRRVSTVLITALILSACSHKPLKAPCELREGKPDVIGAVFSSLLPDTIVALFADADPCGPLRRLGQD